MPATSSAISVFDLFKIGIGPSSSHTVGPMRAAGLFLADLESRGTLPSVSRIGIDLYGSLALTGPGHGTDRAIMLGLSGEQPESVDPDTIDATIDRIRQGGEIRLAGHAVVAFAERRDLRFNTERTLPLHPNGLTFTAQGGDGSILHGQTYFSIGGGFVMTEQEARSNTPLHPLPPPPFHFRTAEDLLRIGQAKDLSIARVVLSNEISWRREEEVRKGLDTLWQVMQDCIDRGLHADGSLPGGLGVRRRAAKWYRELTSRPEKAFHDATAALDWINLYALAVNEENAAGGRVVTAPTNGAAGIVPAVLRYYERFCPGANREKIHDFLLTAAGIGALYKANASISGAEVGCQGEVGVACSMAAGGLTAALGGSNEQIENAAEVGMEHNLGLTCDPVGGLVQIPCIERNAMAAVKAVNAARIALHGDGTHKVSLDKVIETMRQTGLDMMTKYKETSQGGLAVNVVEC